MIKRILAGAAAAGFAATLLTAGSATAATCTTETAPHAGGTLDQATTPGGHLYGSQDGTGGYIGTSGNNGWIEVSGGTSGVTLSGNSTPDAVEGKLVVGNPPSLCVNGTQKP